MTTPPSVPPPPEPPPVRQYRPADPERGLRGVISAILILEAITVALGITAIQNGGMTAPRSHIVILAVLAVAHIAACAVVRRPYALIVIAVLQAALIACWFFSGAVGVIGIVFTLVWASVVYMRREFRRRLAAETSESQEPAGADPADEER